MARMIDIEKLKPLLSNVLTEENETAFIEAVMADSIDYDEEAINARINEAVEAAKAEEAKAYSAKLHDMFFGGKEEPDEPGEDDTKVDPELSGTKLEVEDIFKEVN